MCAAGPVGGQITQQMGQPESSHHTRSASTKGPTTDCEAVGAALTHEQVEITLKHLQPCTDETSVAASAIRAEMMLSEVTTSATLLTQVC